MKAQVMRTKDGVSAIVYSNRFRKWVSIPVIRHIRLVNLLSKTETYCEGILEEALRGRYSKDHAAANIRAKFKKIEDEVLTW